ncbi:MAG: hypothetical protein EOP83_16470, partial [Verrucomicrobiaceae bacterium]
MYAPYTDHPAVAFQAAQIATGALLALAGGRSLRERGPLPFASWMTATWLAVAASGLGPERTGTVHGILGVSALLLLAAALLSGRRAATRWTAGSVALLFAASVFLTDFDLELCAAHLALAGSMIGLLAEPSRPRESGAPGSRGG